MRRNLSKRANLGQLHYSSPAHTTATTITVISSTATTGRTHTWPQQQQQQPRWRPSTLPTVSRVYPQLLPHHYYHSSTQRQQKERAPTRSQPMAVPGNAPAAEHSCTIGGGSGGTGGSPAAGSPSTASTQAAPGSTPDGPSQPVANQAVPGAPAAPNPSGAADLRESTGERGEAAAGGHEEVKAAGFVGGGGVAAGGEGADGGGGDPRALPPPTEGGNSVKNLEVDGKPITLDHLGPLVVHKDGALSRISNWGEMTENERQNTLRILVKRNQVRLGALRQGLQSDGDGTK
ncbi:hypothetical protein DHEL01_v209572 [Diaporthe helianthi]|uniref:Uncharacterized protein n=1 Tax=Diaporthe helianthi TaxID=158607 RepID=A0A2P5HP55_DIAHE|nr:hypothetical protein DHEL01_v209572 [Diaporthe helianthi]